MAGSNVSAKAQAALGLPEGFKQYSPFPFAGMNVQASPVAVADQEFIWSENWFRLGDGNLRTAWDVGAPLFRAPGDLSVVWYAFYTIGSSFFAAFFLSDGSAVQVDANTLVETQIGPAGTFYQTATNFLPYGRQWGTQYLLISNRNTRNDYWIWDGAILYRAGTAAPGGVSLLASGANYNTQPIMTAFGGSGFGMQFSAVVNGGQVALVNIVNPGQGYQSGDVVQIQFQGGGSDSGAILQAYLTPGVVSGVNVTSGGAGYTTASVFFSGGGGSGATAVANLIDGQVQSITMTNEGSGYITAPTITILGDGLGALALAVVSGSSVAGVNVVNGGSGFTSVPLITFVGGGGAGATATVLLAPTTVASILVTSGGQNYTSAPTVTIDGATPVTSNVVQRIQLVAGGTGYTTVPTVAIVGGQGTGATAVATIFGGAVTGFVLTSGGSGYLGIPGVTITGGGGTGAAANADMTTTSGTGATAVASVAGGVVTSITITDPGSGFVQGATVAISGGGGSGATASVVYAGSAIASVVMASGGQFYTSAPAVEVTPGANNAAYATVALMPFGVSGSAIETFLSRVWILNPAASEFQTTPPGVIANFTAPGSVTDFATSDGGGGFVSSDAFLQTQFVNIRQSSGYLYTYGDGSVNVISNVTTQGTPVSTTFSNQNVDPQAGLAWRDALQDFGRSTILANATGVYGLYGGAATKISGKLDQLFDQIVLPPVAGAVTPSAAIAIVFNIKHYLLLVTVVDPDTGQQRNVLLTWNEKDWFVTSQTVTFTFIATQKVGSFYVAWGMDGKNVYPLFQKPSETLQKRLDTKYYGTDRMVIEKSLLGCWLQASDRSTDAAGVSGQLAIVTSGIAAQNAQFPSVHNQTWPTTVWNSQPSFEAPAPYFPIWGSAPGGLNFITCGLRLTTTSPDFILSNWVVGYTEVSAFYGA